jgi:hypothetical protein
MGLKRKDKPYFIGDKILVNTNANELMAIGITDPYQVGWLLNGKVKTISRVENNKLFIIDERNTAAWIWIYKNMTVRWRGAADLG